MGSRYFWFVAKKQRFLATFCLNIVPVMLMSFIAIHALGVWKSIYFFTRIHFRRNFWAGRNFWCSTGQFAVQYTKKHQKMRCHEGCLCARSARAVARTPIYCSKMNSYDKIDAFSYPKRLGSSKTRRSSSWWSLNKNWNFRFFQNFFEKNRFFHENCWTLQVCIAMNFVATHTLRVWKQF